MSDLSEIITGALVVVAGNRDEAQAFARQMELKPRQWSFLDRAHKIRGQFGRPFILVGSYQRRRDIDEVLLQLRLQHSKQVSVEFVHRICGRKV